MIKKKRKNAHGLNIPSEVKITNTTNTLRGAFI